MPPTTAFEVASTVPIEVGAVEAAAFVALAVLLPLTRLARARASRLQAARATARGR